MKSGLLLANPIPAEHSIPLEQVEGAISAAIHEAEEQGIIGKDNTPFILKRIKELTGGQSVPANRALIESNVIRGTKVAVELSKLERGAGCRFPHENTASICNPNAYQNQRLPHDSPTTAAPDWPLPPKKAELLVAGSLAIDLSCDFAPLPLPNKVEASPRAHTSNPSVISQTVGGVGLNVATAAHLCGTRTLLCSAVGSDLSGRIALETLSQLGLQTRAVKVLDRETGKKTAQYVAVNDTKKELVLAMADMGILEGQSESFNDVWEPEITREKPKWLVLDANWGVETLRKWISSGKAAGAKIAFEPVSAEKSTRLLSSSTALGVFPNHEVDIATPNFIELSAMHTAAREVGMLDRQDWWQIIDSLGIHGGARDRFIALTSPALVNQGIPQQALQLLPFLPCLLTKLGPQGVLLTQLLRPGDERLSSPDAARYVLSRSPDGRSEVGGVYMRLFSAAEVVPEEDIVNVTGVGDTFLGILVAGITKGKKTLEELVEIAQRGSVLTLKSKEPVSPRVGELKRELEN
jgi:pseudouridylate synthase / pseudouridine kinase